MAKQKETERQLIELINNHNNDNKCGDCGNTYPTWASASLGIFLCGRCASIHKRVLPEKISNPKSLTLDYWSPDQIEKLRRIGNKKANKVWNSAKEPFPYDDDDVSEIEQFIKNKYLLGKYRDTPIHRPRSTSMGQSNYTSLNSGRLRLNSQAVPSLTHRKLTTFESTQYKKQVNQILSFGYKNPDSILEALLLSEGEVEVALDILDNDSRVNPSQQEIAPNLPSRPRPSQSAPASVSDSSTNPMISLIDSEPKTHMANDWWSGNSTPSATSSVTPQIYQYTDPITGQISYIDSNGQQYLDPNNAEHQKLLYQQPLAPQQTNKQQILSLYNRPDNFTSMVAVPVDANQQSQQQTYQQLGFQQPAPQQSFQQVSQQMQGVPQAPQQFQQYQFTQQPTGMGFQQPFPGQYQNYQ